MSLYIASKVKVIIIWEGQNTRSYKYAWSVVGYSQKCYIYSMRWSSSLYLIWQVWLID